MKRVPSSPVPISRDNANVRWTSLKIKDHIESFWGISSHSISSTVISKTSLESNTWISDATVTVKPESSSHSAFTVSHGLLTSQHVPICTANYKDSMNDIAPSTSFMVIYLVENHQS